MERELFSKIDAERAVRPSRQDIAKTLMQLDHDLRTPLGTLVSALDLVQSHPQDAALRAEACQVMSRQVDRLAALARSVQALAQEVGKDKEPASWDTPSL